MRRVNVFDDDLLAVDEDEPDGYRTAGAKVSQLLGAERLAASVYRLAPGAAVCPYHYEVAEEEWLLVLAGTPTVRVPDGEVTLAAGDVWCFPAGPAGAHLIANAAAEPARVLVVSDRHDLAAAVYPDSDKLGVFTADGADEGYFAFGDRRDYWDGEPPRSS